MQNKQKKIEQVNTKQLLMTEQTVRKLQNDIVSTHLIWKLIHNLFTPEILLVILFIVYHTILMIKVWRILFRINY